MVIQRNPSTGKLSRNPVTGKLQAVGPPSPCVECTSTPLTIRVTIANVDSASNGCSLCSQSGSPLVDVDWTGVPSNINGAYILQQIPENPCEWEYVENDTYSVDSYTSTDGTCTNFNQTSNYAGWRLVLRYTSGWILWLTAIGDGVPDAPCFRTPYTSASKCVEVADETMVEFNDEFGDNCFPFFDTTTNAIFTIEEI